MQKTVFVFGAGASRGAYPGDLIDHGTPLTSDLFSHPDFRSSLGIGEACSNLLEQEKKSADKSFDLEASLAQLSRTAGVSRQSELMDIRFAIQEVIRKTASKAFSYKPKRSSFYADLWFRVRACLDDTNTATFINMNYDTILDSEMAISEGVFESFDKYLSSKHWSLLHPHGCISWGYGIPEVMNKNLKKEDIVGQASTLLTQNLELVHIKKPFPSAGELYSGPKPPCFPAIAMPIAGSNEKEHFVCPQEQIDELDKLREGVSSLVLIGWRALDDHVLKKIALGCATLKHLHIVSFTVNGAKFVNERLESFGVKSENTDLIAGGFEKYLTSPSFAALFPNPATVVKR